MCGRWVGGGLLDVGWVVGKWWVSGGWFVGCLVVVGWFVILNTCMQVFVTWSLQAPVQLVMDGVELQTFSNSASSDTDSNSDGEVELGVNARNILKNDNVITRFGLLLCDGWVGGWLVKILEITSF